MTAYLRGAVPAVAGEATPPAGDSGSAPAERAAPKRPATKPRGDLLPARLAPVGIRPGAKGSEIEGAWALFDSDASTRFAPRAATRLEVDLGQPTAVDGFGAFGPADGAVTVMVPGAGGGDAVPLAGAADLRGLPMRWNRVHAASPVTTDKLLIEWEPAAAGAAAPELELWGRRLAPPPADPAPLADRLLTDMPPGAVVAYAYPDEAEVSLPTVGYGGTAAFHADLDADVRGFTRAFLVYELAGLPHWSAVRRQVNGLSVVGGFHAVAAQGGTQVEEISPAWLRAGKNRVDFHPRDTFDPTGYKVKNLRIVAVPASAAEETEALAIDKVPAALIDGDPSTALAPASGARGGKRARLRGVLDLPLRRPSQPESLWISVDRPLSGSLSVVPVETVQGAELREGTPVTVEGKHLVPGWNRIALDDAPPRTEGLRIRFTGALEGAGAIGEVRVAASPAPREGGPRLVISSPLHGECVDHQVYVRGFVTPPDRAGVALSLNGAPAFGAVQADGGFGETFPERASGVAAGKPWHIDVRATYADGRTLEQRVRVDGCTPTPPAVAQSDGNAKQPVEDVGAPYGQVVHAGEAATLAFDGARLEIPAGAVEGDVRVTVRPLDPSQVPAMDEGMADAIPEGRAFRLGPHGLTFKKPVKLTLPYDPDRFPAGMSEQDLVTYFFDAQIGHWREVPTVAGEGGRHRLTAETTHFTDFITATIKAPDHPTADSFNPNTIKNIKLGDPAAGIDLIAPPSASPDGAAHLTYPIELPPGRQGMRPDLRLAYSSDGGNGWIGVGWDLATQKIAVDTRFGVPRYDGSTETESYLIDGAQLVPIDDARDPSLQRLSPGNRVSERQFVRRVEGGFEQIIRHGSSPSETGGGQAYSWEVIDKHGTHFIYGDPPGSTGTAVLSAPNGGPIAEWRLRSVTDTFGNRIDYEYFVECGSLPGAGGQNWTQIYPLLIHYTANGSQVATYHVRFFLDDTTVPPRPDIFTSARYGFLTRTAHLLQHVVAESGANEASATQIRSYDLEYIIGEFGKKLLSSVAVTRFKSNLVAQNEQPSSWRTALATLLPGFFNRSACGGGVFAALGLVVCPTSPLQNNPAFDAGGTPVEFYRHKFDYFRRTDPTNTPLAFGQLTPWGTVAQSDGLNRNDDISGGLNAFAGIGPVDCYPHAGIGGGFNIGEENISRAFMDVNGDGIPDAIASDGTAFFGQRDSGYVGASVPGFDTVSHSLTTTISLGGAAHFFGELGAAGFDFTWNNSTADHDLIDIDGDGLPDSVQGGSGFSVLKNNFGTFAPASFQGFVANRQFVSGSIQQQIRDQHPTVGTVVAWTAPYFGQIQVTGALQRVETGGDGVEATIYVWQPSSQQLVTRWDRTIGANDTGPCVPVNSGDCNSGTPITATVEAGDQIFFNTNAIDDIDHDALTWDPQVSYSTICTDPTRPTDPPVCTPIASPSAAEPYGSPVYSFSGASDFRLAGPPAAPWYTTVNSTVNVDVSGTFQKLAATADDLVVQVIKNNAATKTQTVLFTQTFTAGSPPASQVIAFPVSVTGTVASDVTGPNGQPQPDLHADSIEFRVSSDTPIDPNAFSWAPQLQYESYCRRDPTSNTDVCGAVSCGATTCTMAGDPIPDHPLTPAAVIFNPEVTKPAHPVVPVEIANAVTPPTRSRNLPTTQFAAPEGGTFNVSGTLTQLPLAGNTVITSWDNTFVTVHTPTALLAKQSVAGNTRTSTVTFNNLTVTAGTPLTFTVWVNGDGVASWTPQLTFQSGDSFIAPASVHRILPSAQAPVGPRLNMSGGYHQWTFGQWTTTNAFDPKQISLLDNTQSNGPPPNFVAVNPQHLGITADAQQGVAGISQPIWRATGIDLYVAAGQVKPSRLGANAAALIARGNGPGLRKGSGTTSGLSATLIGSASDSSGSSSSDLEMLDLNGDNYPDSFDDQGIRYNNGTGFGPTVGLPGLRTIRSINSSSVRFGFGFGSAASAVAGAVHASGTVKSMLSLLPSFGETYNRSVTASDLVDINGDGLPDHVQRDGTANTLIVNLNLGYSFGPDVAWTTPDWTEKPPAANHPAGDVTVKDDDANNLSLRDNGTNSLAVSYAGIGGGLAQSSGRTYVEQLDVNGDGLTDQVMKIPGERVLHVKINRGEFFDPEVLWQMPDFTTTTGQQIQLESPLMFDFGSNDALGFSENRAVNAGVGIAFTIPIVYVCLAIEISAQADFGGGFSEMTMQDINGDGFPDQVLKKDGDQNVYVKISQPGLQHFNLLREVDNPLGGSFTLDYNRAGNLVDQSNAVDMPHNHWVLSSVTTENGFLDDQRDSRTTTFDYHQSGFYDRGEREDFGFSHVTTTRPDGSFLDQTFLNGDFYRKGLLAKAIEKDANGTLFRKLETTWQSRTAHGTGVASVFPADVTEVTSFYEGQTSNEASPGKTWTVTHDYDGNGNITSMVDTGDVGTGDDVSYTITYQPDIITSGHIFRANFIEARDASNNVLRHRTAVYESHGAMQTMTDLLAGGTSADTGAAQNTSLTWTFNYDGLGNLHDATGPEGHKLTYGYDSLAQQYQTSVTDNTFGYTSSSTPSYDFGTVASTTDINGNLITYNRDGFGRILTVVDPDDQAIAEDALFFEYHVPNFTQAFPASCVTHHHDVQHPNDPLDTATFIDGLARPIQTKKDAVIDDSASGTGTVGHSISGRVIYDARGRVFRQGQMQSELGTSVPISQYTKLSLVNPSTFAYDILSRTRSVETPDAHGTVQDIDGNPVAQTLTDYNFATLDGVTRLTKQVKDPQGKVRTGFRTVRDDFVALQEQNTLVRGGPLVTLTTRYVTDPLSELTQVTDQNGNVTTGQYDTLGHLVVLVSKDAGRSEIRYDSVGRMAAKQTPNLAATNKFIRYGYNTDRLETITYPNIPSVTYTYGDASEAGVVSGNVAGRVKSVTDESGTETRRYDVLGNVAVTFKTPTPLAATAPKPSYTMSYVYDLLGRMLSMTYPDKETVSYTYDAGGLVTGVSGEGTVNGTVTYVSGVTYDRFGARRVLTLGNGVTSTYTYDDRTLRLNELKTVSGSTVVQDLAYGYDLVGNVTSLANQLAIPAPVTPNTVIAPGPTTFTFGYDDLYQLIAATGRYDGCACGCNNNRQFTESMTYDAIGNIVHKTQKDVINWPSGRVDTEAATTYDVAYTYAAGHPHEPATVGAQTLSYDANGNMKTSTGTFGPARTLTWDEENRVASEVDRGFTNTYLYNDQGDRTHKRRTLIETVYVNPYYVIRSGTLQTKHVMLGEARVASTMASLSSYGQPTTSSASTFFYYHPDSLQSTHYTTDKNGQLLQHDEYFPTGEVWFEERLNNDARNAQPYLFNAKELDETGLYYYGARYYDARQSTWISPDPALKAFLSRVGSGGVFQPANLELYTYTYNNPVVLRDPSGMAPEGGVGQLTFPKPPEFVKVPPPVPPAPQLTLGGGAESGPPGAAIAGAASLAKDLVGRNFDIPKLPYVDTPPPGPQNPFKLVIPKLQLQKADSVMSFALQKGIVGPVNKAAIGASNAVLRFFHLDFIANALPKDKFFDSDTLAGPLASGIHSISGVNGDTGNAVENGVGGALKFTGPNYPTAPSAYVVPPTGPVGPEVTQGGSPPPFPKTYLNLGPFSF
jgi:RHS repeat-associated protein